MEYLIPEAEASRRFGQLADGFDRAAASDDGHVIQTSCTFGGHAVAIRTAGCALAGLTRPFEHLRTDADPSAASLRIDIRDPLATGTVQDGLFSAAEETAISEGGRYLVQSSPAGVVAFDRRACRIAGAIAWERCLGVYQKGKPLARVLAEWYADRQVPIIHAGLVTSGDQGVVLGGRGGSGKSTFAVACARAGLGFAGEDYTALEFTGTRGILGHSAYNSVFLEPEAATWFPELADHLMPSVEPGEPKSVVLLSDVWPDRLVARAAIRAVALCRVGAAPAASIRPASRAEALRALAPSSLLQVHGRRRDSLDRLARLVETVPSFHVDLGRDLASAAVTVRGILSMAAAT